MNFDRLFSAVVVGGAVLASGCGPKQAAPAVEQAAGVAPEATPAATQADAADPAEPAPEAAGGAGESETKVDCDAVCSGGPDRDMVCPDPDQGIENCCWLMATPHECCPD